VAISEWNAILLVLYHNEARTLPSGIRFERKRHFLQDPLPVGCNSQSSEIMLAWHDNNHMLKNILWVSR